MSRERRDRRSFRDRARGRPAAHAAELAEVERARLRLELLHEIGKHLLRLGAVERTTRAVLGLVSEAIPLEIAILLLGQRGGSRRTRAIVWEAGDVDAARMRAARAHARAVHGYLRRPDLQAEAAEEEELGERLPPRVHVDPAAAIRAGTARRLVLPLVDDQARAFGVLLLEGAAPLDESDLTFASAVANQLAVALDRQALALARQEALEAGRVAAEEMAAAAEARERTQRFLAEASALVSSSLDHEETLAAMVRAAVPFLADLCFMDEVGDDQRLVRRQVALSDPAALHLAEQLRAPARGEPLASPQARVVATGAPLVLEDGSLERAGHDPAHADALRAAGARAAIVVPLVARARVLGVLTLVRISAVGYGPAELALALDLASRAALALDNAQLYEQARRATRARDELLAIVSHDLRSPLATISMTVSMLLEEPDVTAIGRASLERVQRSTQRMTRIISDLLDLASIDAGHLAVELERHPVAELLLEALEQSQLGAARKSVALELVEMGPPPPRDVLCDRERVLQVFGNLLGNAIKFTPRGGIVRLCAEQRAREVVFAVSDTGPGIPPVDMPRLFDRFWRAKATAAPGTGLGLSIAKGLVEAQAGRMWAESRPGEGATFRFTLPCAGRE